jgi:hypothetical protein
VGACRSGRRAVQLWRRLRRSPSPRRGYVDRILKGEKAGELPIQLRPSLMLIENQKTARELGITVPPSVLVRAEEVY